MEASGSSQEVIAGLNATDGKLSNGGPEHARMAASLLFASPVVERTPGGMLHTETCRQAKLRAQLPPNTGHMHTQTHTPAPYLTDRQWVVAQVAAVVVGHPVVVVQEVAWARTLPGSSLWVWVLLWRVWALLGSWR